MVHGAGDAAFHGEPLVVTGATWTTRLPASAVLYGPKPPPTGWRGRPAEEGKRLGTCADIARSATWQAVTVHVDGEATTVQAAVVDALWHGSFKGAAGRVVLVRDPGSGKSCDLGLFTLDTATTAAIAERCSWRWAIEPPNATGKQIMGAGDACNRVERAVERTVPSGFLLLCPWYPTKTEPSPADMPAKLRREFPKARFSAIKPAHDHSGQIDDYFWTCDITAA